MGMKLFRNRLSELKRAYDGLALSMNLAAKDFPNYKKELGVLHDQWAEIGDMILA